MFYTLFIYTKQAELMKLENGISDELLKLIDRKKTSFGDNSILNSVVSDGDFIEDLATSQFEFARKALLGIDRIEGVDDSDSLNNVLQKLIVECKKIEEPNKVKIEEICANIVKKKFLVPEDTLTIKTELVEKVDCSNISFDKLNGDYSLDSIKDNNVIKSECDKRRILNALSIGAGLYYSINESIYEKEIKEVDERLLGLYKAINALNMYLLFDGAVKMTEENNKMTGVVTVRANGNDKMPEISAQGLVFPILLAETVRGLMELFAMHGLPKDRDLKKLVLNKCDYLKSEPWYMRIGLELWRKTKINFESKPGMVPYWFKELAVIKPMKFNEVMPEILSNTNTGKKYSKIIYRKALSLFDKDNFNSDMSKLTMRKNIITDNTL